MNKWIGISLGGILGITHIGMIGMIGTQKGSKLPKIDIPHGDYTSYVISASEEGYKISYSANDPKTAYITKDIKEPGNYIGTMPTQDKKSWAKSSIFIKKRG